jgi:hypothetical protein
MMTMRRLLTALSLVALCGVLALNVPAGAATPAGGTLSKKKKSLSWTGSFLLSEPSPVDGCIGEDASSTCDRFMLKLDLGEGAKVKVVLPSQLGDLDLYVWAPGRILVGLSGNPPGAGESVEFTHRARYRNRAYTVEVKPFAVVPTTSYKATATVLKLGAK